MSKTTERPREESRGQVQLKQGDIIKIASTLLPSIPLPKLEKSAQDVLVIIASHDCDIYASAQTEQFIEIIPIELISKLNSKHTHTRNARKLDIEVQESLGNKRQPIRIEAANKRSIPKTCLWDKDFSRPYNLDTEDRIELADWLSSRYRRAALPEEFAKRFKRIEEDFWKLVQEYNHQVSAILFYFDEGQEKKECKECEPYSLSMFLVFPKDKAEPNLDSLAEEMQALFEKNFNNQLSGYPPEIEIRHCLAISESQITLEVYKAGVFFRSEWISYGTDPPGPVISV